MNEAELPTIEQGLLNRIPPPWKMTTCDGPTRWKVARRRPEEFTAEIHERLRRFGIKDEEIRELFYVGCGDWARIKADAGVKKKIVPENEMDKQVIPDPRPVIRLKSTPVEQLKKIILDEPAPDLLPPPPVETIQRPQKRIVELAAELMNAIKWRKNEDKIIEQCLSQLHELTRP